MKNLLVLLAVLTMLFSSCVSKKTNEATISQRDSLEQVVRAKDSLIEAVFADINAISENLSAIKARENIITAVDPEGIRRPIDQINSDIAAIDKLLEENRERLDALQKTAAQLRRANLKISSLENLIKELRGQIEDKDDEIRSLHARLTEVTVEMEQLEERLTEEIEVKTTQVDSLTTTSVTLDEQLNSVYYIVGQEKKLREAQIIDKRGFIGRTLTTSENNSLDFFMKTDSRELVEVPIRQKRVTVVTSHPEGSYQLIMADKVVLKLVITDPVRFWESSKVLIVSYK